MYVCLHCKTYLTANVYAGRNIFSARKDFRGCVIFILVYKHCTCTVILHKQSWNFFNLYGAQESIPRMSKKRPGHQKQGQTGQGHSKLFH
jgi:hypothetical protein